MGFWDAKKMVYIRGSGKEELEGRIYQYFDEINKVSVPYHWFYKLDEIEFAKKIIFRIYMKL